MLWTREVIALCRALFAQQLDALAGVFTRYKVQRCCLDQTGMGEAVVEQAKHGKYRVEGVLFTSTAKQQLATVGKQADGLVRIPVNRAERQPSGCGRPQADGTVLSEQQKGEVQSVWHGGKKFSPRPKPPYKMKGTPHDSLNGRQRTILQTRGWPALSAGSQHHDLRW